MRPIR